MTELTSSHAVEEHAPGEEIEAHSSLGSERVEQHTGDERGVLASSGREADGDLGGGNGNDFEGEDEEELSDPAGCDSARPPVTEFYDFDKLPIELQTMVWKEATLDDEGVLQITLTDTRVLNENNRVIISVSSPTKPTSLFLACKHSRKEALKLRTGCISYQHRRIRFNPDTHTIFIYNKGYSTLDELKEWYPFHYWGVDELPDPLALMASEDSRPSPGIYLDYHNLFQDIKYLILAEEHIHDYTPHLLHEFGSLKTLYVANRFTQCAFGKQISYGPYDYTVRSAEGKELSMFSAPEDLFKEMRPTCSNHIFSGLGRVHNQNTRLSQRCGRYKARKIHAAGWDIPKIEPILLRAAEDYLDEGGCEKWDEWGLESKKGDGNEEGQVVEGITISVREDPEQS